MAKGFKVLTRAHITKLKPGGILREGGIEYHHKVREGGTWYINAMVDGQRIHRKIGKNGRSGQDGEYTLTDCVAALEKMKADAREDRLNLPKGRQVPMTFAQAAEEYLKREAEIGGKDLQRKTATLRLYLVPFFKNMPLGKLTTFDVEKYKNHRLTGGTTLGGDRMSPKARKKGQAIGGQKKDLAPGTVNRELATLSHLLSRALEYGWITHKSAVVKRLPLDESCKVALTPEESNALMEAAWQDRHPQIYAFVAIGLSSGMRKSEILAIRLRDVDIKNATIYVPKAKKGPRTQPMSPIACNVLKGIIELLEKWGGEIDWLFPADSESGHTVNIEDAFKRVVKAAGLDPKKVTPHTMRNSVITQLHVSGVDVATIQRISGHKDPRMVFHYARPNDPHIQKALMRQAEEITSCSNNSDKTASQPA